jgi:hypothetical protein
MLDAAKLSLKEAERFEASADEVERSRSNDCSVGSIDAERVENLRKFGRDELLLANAQASIAVAEALSKQATSPDELFRRAGFGTEKLRERSAPSFYCGQPGCTTCPRSSTDR